MFINLKNSSIFNDFARPNLIIIIPNLPGKIYTLPLVLRMATPIHDRPKTAIVSHTNKCSTLYYNFAHTIDAEFRLVAISALQKKNDL